MPDLLSELLDLLLPPACAGCGRSVSRSCEVAALCPACDAQLPRLEQPRDPRPPRPLRVSVAAVAFAGQAETWVHRFKYPARGLRGLDPGPGAVLRRLVLEAAAHLEEQPDVIVPVPQHPRALRARGFFPAGQLARELAKASHLRVRYDAIARTRPTPSQTSLTRRERVANMRGAFAPRHRLEGTAALVDDVTTTGSTLREAARALRRAGARRVVAVCVARTL